MTELGFAHRYVEASREGLPTLLLLHGTGGNEHDLLPLGESLAPGAARLSVRGKVLENGMPRFFRRFAEGVFDEEDLRFRTHELADFLTTARGAYGIAGEFLAVGYSNGANIAASLMLLHPGLLAGGVLLRAMPPFAITPSVDLAGVRVLLASGRRDPIVPVELTEKLKTMFELSNAEVSLHWHNGGHELGQDDIVAAQEWLAL